MFNVTCFILPALPYVLIYRYYETIVIARCPL